MNYSALVAALMPAVQEAGAAILDIKAKNPISLSKSDGSPVTIADHAAEKILLAALAKICPEVPVISEETPENHRLVASEKFFLVDPLDGTKEFLRVENNGDYTVNIGLIEHNMPVMGIVYAPALGTLYWGDAYSGAALQKDQRTTSIKVRKVPNSGAVAVTSASHLDTDTTNWLSKQQITQTKSIGSSLKFALLASGRADVYPRFGPTMEWDTAAGDAILRAAGGMMCNPNGQVYRYGKDGYRNTPFIAFGQRIKYT